MIPALIPTGNPLPAVKTDFHASDRSRPGHPAPEYAMNTTAEIWIDHQNAVVTTMSDQGRTMSEVRIHAAGQLHPFFTEVIAAIGTALTVLVFGPDEAKTELGQRLQRMPVMARVHAMGTTGTMTPRQIADRARDHHYT